MDLPGDPRGRSLADLGEADRQRPEPGVGTLLEEDGAALVEDRRPNADSGRHVPNVVCPDRPNLDRRRAGRQAGHFGSNGDDCFVALPVVLVVGEEQAGSGARLEPVGPAPEQVGRVVSTVVHRQAPSEAACAPDDSLPERTMDPQALAE